MGGPKFSHVRFVGEEMTEAAHRASLRVLWQRLVLSGAYVLTTGGTVYHPCPGVVQTNEGFLIQGNPDAVNVIVAVTSAITGAKFCPVDHLTSDEAEARAKAYTGATLHQLRDQWLRRVAVGLGLYDHETCPPQKVVGAPWAGAEKVAEVEELTGSMSPREGETILGLVGSATTRPMREEV